MVSRLAAVEVDAADVAEAARLGARMLGASVNEVEVALVRLGAGRGFQGGQRRTNRYAVSTKRVDGTISIQVENGIAYVTVTQPKGSGYGIDAEDAEKELAAWPLDEVDHDAFRGAVEEAAGRPVPFGRMEAVAEADPEAQVIIKVGDDRLVAYAVALPPARTGPLERGEVIRALQGAGVVAGILDSEIHAFLENEPRSRPVAVARAIPPRAGQDATLQFYFPTDPGKEPRPVGAGDLLALKKPMARAQHGIALTGELLETPEAKDIDLEQWAGEGTKLSAKGDAIIAALPGNPFLAGKKIGVRPLPGAAARPGAAGAAPAAKRSSTPTSVEVKATTAYVAKTRGAKMLNVPIEQVEVTPVARGRAGQFQTRVPESTFMVAIKGSDGKAAIAAEQGRVVARVSAPQGSGEPATVQQTLEALAKWPVADLDEAALQRAVSEAAGDAVVIGRLALPQGASAEGALLVKVADDESAAYIVGIGKMAAGAIDEGSIRQALLDAGVTHGVIPAAVQDVARAPRRETPVEVARATDSVEGSDARMEFLFGMRQQGRAVSVGEGQALVRKIPGRPGEPSRSVAGTERGEAKMGLDIDLRPLVGEGTALAESGNEIVAQVAGAVFLIDGKVTVVAELPQVPGAPGDQRGDAGPPTRGGSPNAGRPASSSEPGFQYSPDPVDGRFAITFVGLTAYLQVVPPEGHGDPVDPAAVEREVAMLPLDALDRNALTRTIHESTGLPEPFGHFNPVRDGTGDVPVVKLSHDDMRAYLIVSRATEQDIELAPGEDPPVESSIVHRALAEMGVSFGLADDRITEVCDRGLRNHPILAALGTFPVHGQDGRLEYLFEADEPRRPTLLSRGRVDYRDIATIRDVDADETIARVISPTTGESGFTVRGAELPARPGKPIQVRPFLGDGTKLSEDESEIQATAAGKPLLSGTRIRVLPTHEVRGSVDFSTGNVVFRGNVLVVENVQSSFMVRAGGHVQINGWVEAAEVRATGRVIIRGGFEGRGKGRIISGEHIAVLFVNRGIVNAGRILAVGSELLYSSVVAGEGITVGGRGVIIGGVLEAGQLIEASVIGSPTETALTRLVVGRRALPTARSEDGSTSRVQRPRVIVRECVYPGVTIQINKASLRITEPIPSAVFEERNGQVDLLPYRRWA